MNSCPYSWMAINQSWIYPKTQPTSFANNPHSFKGIPIREFVLLFVDGIEPIMDYPHNQTTSMPTTAPIREFCAPQALVVFFVDGSCLIR